MKKAISISLVALVLSIMLSALKQFGGLEITWLGAFLPLVVLIASWSLFALVIAISMFGGFVITCISVCIDPMDKTEL